MRSWILGSHNTLIVERALNDIKRGHRVVFIDPNGSATDLLLSHFPRRDAVLFNPADYDWPIAWNPLADIPEEHRAFTASAMLDTFRSIYRYTNLSTPDFDQTMYMSLAAMLDTSGTIMGIAYLLSSPQYRKRIVPRIKDTVVKDLWERFEELPEKDKREVLKSSLNKMATLIADPRIRHTIGQPRSAFSLSDTGVLMARLPRGQLGAQKSSLLGSLLIAQLCATPGTFRVYIVDPHRFDGTALLDLIGDPRFHITVSNAYLSQLSRQLQAALFGEVDRRYVFRVGLEDSERLHKTIPADNIEFKLHELARHEARIFEGMAMTRGTFDPLSSGAPKIADAVAMRSRRSYASPRKHVEEQMERFMAETGAVRFPKQNRGRW